MPKFDSVGTKSTEISVEISTRFLEHFSEQLYSSPQKAFEELISNGWDAGSSYVDVRVATDLSASDATMSVLDNGVSMNEDGLRALWHIAFSEKANAPEAYGRKIIGKFGIGKLATYVLANKLTYFCKADDGIIRRVTMDYGRVQKSTGSTEDTLLSELNLDIYEVAESEMRSAVEGIHGGVEILNLIDAGIPDQLPDSQDDGFGGVAPSFERPSKETWTLAILSDLKPIGRELKVGVLRRMLSSALPFGSDMTITLNGAPLESSKIDTPVLSKWTIGPELGISEISIRHGNGGNDDSDPDANNIEKIAVKSVGGSNPRVEIDGIGPITGTVWLFESRISSGKSEERGASNGFHVNVLGRVVNQADPSFGEENLSHAAWARFRMAVRADGLNASLVTNREQFRETKEIRVFRAFLRKVFNLARNNYDSDPGAGLSDGGDLLVKALGVISLNPLRAVVSDALAKSASVPELFDESNITDREQAYKTWRARTAEDISEALGEVKYESYDDKEIARFRISDSAIVINNNHPFVLEHSKKAEKQLIRSFAMINLLTDFYSLEQGVSADVLQGVREYRDRLLRFHARKSRRSGLHIAQLLLSTQHDSDNSKHLETAVTDALVYLGFDVTPLGQAGQPEGVADAFTTPSRTPPTSDEPNPPLYRFTYDAKSSKSSSAKTGNLSLDGVKEHKTRYKADYALVVAPGFQKGAVVPRCTELGVTPITARDLGRLLELTARYGALPIPKMRDIFSLYDPDQVSTWIDELETHLRTSNHLTLATFLDAIQVLRRDVPDGLAASLVAFTCRKDLHATEVQDKDVIALASGLSVIVPELVGVVDDKIVINASAERVAEAVNTQLESLRISSGTAQ